MRRGSDDSDGIMTLVKETVDGLGRLIADHVKLARLELVADVKVQGRRAATVALIVPFIFLGYGLACVGLSLALRRWLGMPGAFFAVGGVHFLGGALAVAIAVARLRNAGLMRQTASEVSLSLTTLSQAPAAGGANGTSVSIDVRDAARSRVAALGVREG
jgi:hypothetical protein